MKILLSLLLFICFQASAQQPVSLTQQINEISKAEQLRNQRLTPQGTPGTADILNAQSNIDAKYYRCEWEVDPAVRYIKGNVTIYYNILETGTSISFDLMSPLVVDSVKQRNTLLSISHSNNVLQISFPASVNAGKFDSVSIYYQGVPPTAGFGSFVQTSHAGVPVMWSLSEPFGARDWWPCKNGLEDKADSMDVFITTPPQYKAASNGILQSETLIAGGTKLLTAWKHRYPIATYLVAFAVTNYTIINQSLQMGTQNIPMVTYAYPESALTFQNSLVHTQLAMQVFHKIAGDYPFSKEKYGHVQFSWGGGMEHQTCSFMGGVPDYLIAHELAHQWFGNKVTCGSWEDIWLNEGFASLLTRIFFEAKYPGLEAGFRKDDIASVVAQPGGSVKVDDTTSVSRIFSGRLTYTKGGLVLNMLRYILTDSVFFKGVRNYLNDPKLTYGFARTTDLVKHLEAVSGKSLTLFMNDWFSGQGYPTYNVEWTPVGSNYVKIKMNQTQSHASVNFFELPVALKFKNATQQKTIVLDNTTNGQQFFENIGFVADSVFIDPDYWLISKNNTVTKIADNAAQNTVQVYPNPIQSQFSVYLRNMTASAASILLYNAAGQLLVKQQVNLVNGSQFVEVPSKHLPAGAYTLRIVTADFKYTKKLLK